ncbi:hypothetical protein [Elongatibacter sediminis]|uniref:Uncharacterized protein n=1 Tax=Elongatibacter sediminis TaxID=3119006 RepID=A0AAW9RIZ4_9GAMM
MRHSICVILIILVAVFSTALQAGSRGGAAHAGEEVCDVLRDGDYTKGLYGLCVAYCQAEARSDKVLANYERKRNEDDPDMPCLVEPDPVCPCWSAEMVGAVLNGSATPVSCMSDDAAEAVFIDFGVPSYEAFSTDASTCAYLLDPDFVPNNGDETYLQLPLQEGEEAACRADIETLCQF